MAHVSRAARASAAPYAAELDLENLLLRIPHVLGARVQVGGDGNLERVHVLATRASGGDRLRADVERVFEEHRALRLDRDVLSVVTLDDDDAPAAVPRGFPAQPPRIELCRVGFDSPDDLTLRVRVDLRLGEAVVTGQVQDTDVPRARPVLAARAVLAALEFLRGRGAAFFLGGVEFLTGFHAPIALAVVEAVSTSGVRPRKALLSGCALVGDSREEAAARATLAAINRFHGAVRSAPR